MTPKRKPRLDEYMSASDPHDAELPDVEYWRTFGRIRHFLRAKGCDPDAMSITLYPADRDTGGWTWWAYDQRFAREPEDNDTNYIHDDGLFEFYGVAEWEG